MIAVSGRALSRAWLAVSLAGSANESSVQHWRTVRVEEYETGIRLIALDGWMAAWCWVPAWDELVEEGWPVGDGTEAEPLDEIPYLMVTVRDSELRVRDLMKHVKAVTGKNDSVDMPVEIDLQARIVNELSPSLLPEWEQPAARFELPTRERVVTEVVQGDFPNWRKIALRDLDGPAGRPAVRRVLNTDYLARLTKIADHSRGGALVLDMPDGASILWHIAHPAGLAHCPSGVLAAVRSYEEEARDPWDGEMIVEQARPAAPAAAATDLVEEVPAPASGTSSAASEVTDIGRARSAGKHKGGR